MYEMQSSRPSERHSAQLFKSEQLFAKRREIGSLAMAIQRTPIVRARIIAPERFLTSSLL
jgi:hypothetical protein